MNNSSSFDMSLQYMLNKSLGFEEQENNKQIDTLQYYKNKLELYLIKHFNISYIKNYIEELISKNCNELNVILEE